MKNVYVRTKKKNQGKKRRKSVEEKQHRCGKKSGRKRGRTMPGRGDFKNGKQKGKGKKTAIQNIQRVVYWQSD